MYFNGITRAILASTSTRQAYPRYRDSDEFDSYLEEATSRRLVLNGHRDLVLRKDARVVSVPSVVGRLSSVRRNER